MDQMLSYHQTNSIKALKALALKAPAALRIVEQRFNVPDFFANYRVTR